MTTETAEPTSLQTGTTPNPIPSNAQDFTGSDDEIMDNFAGGPDPNNDGTPMGLGGEKGKQSEPASSTLEADIVNGTTKQPGETLPPEDPAGAPEPVQDAGEKGPETTPEPDSKEPETPEFPPALLQMAGLADAAAAQAAGFQNPEALFAAVKWRSQLSAPGTQPARPSAQGLYQRPTGQPAAQPAPETAIKPKAEVQPFELPADKMDLLDEDLQGMLRQMNEHYQQELASLRDSADQRQKQDDQRQEQDEAMRFDEEAMRFDKAVQNLGEDWRDVFGEGSGDDLGQAGQSDPVAMTNFNHRVLLFDAARAVRKVNAEQGYKPMALEQEIQWALMQRYPDKFQQTISGNSNSSGPRRGLTASRPTQRNTPPKSQNAKVLSSVNAMLRKKHGYALDMGQEEEFDGEF